MTGTQKRECGTARVAFLIVFATLCLAAIFFGRSLRRIVCEALMQRVTSGHYEILCPAKAMPPEIMRQFASERESLFTALDGKLGDAGSNTEIRIIFDPDFPTTSHEASASRPYMVTGTTIRTRFNGRILDLNSAADAEALLNVAWGKPGNAGVAHWVSLWLVGNWQGQELGMAAAEVEQRLGHKKVATVLGQPPVEVSSPQDRDLLGAAWISQIVEFGGPAEVRKLYSAKMPDVNEAEVAKALGTTSMELERKWQLWMYAYLAGMPPASQSMPMNMQMPTK